MKTLSEEQALSKAAALCSRSEYCIEDIRSKMENWLILPEIQERILKRLTDEKYIDEARFCHSYINDKLHFNKWGKRKIHQMLQLKKIPRDVINKNLSTIDEKDYENILKSLMDSKSKTINAHSEYEKNMKLMRFAIGRGFEYDLIRKFLSDDLEKVD